MILDLKILQSFNRSPTRFAFSHSEKAIPPPSPLGPSFLNYVPDEILQEISAYCPRASLLQLTLTNWRLNRIATPFLYQNATFSSADKMIIFFISLCLQPHLAQLVRNLQVEYSLSKVMLDTPLYEGIFARRMRKLGSKQFNPHKRTMRNALTLVHSGLKAMNNLTSLSLIMSDGDTHEEYGSLLSRVNFRLLHFQTTIRMDQDVMTFLEKQTLLRNLHFLSTGSFRRGYLQTLPLTMLPCLEELSWSSKSSMEVVRTLMHERQVKKVTINMHPGSVFSASLNVGPVAARRVTSANVAFQEKSRPSASHMRTLAAAFPGLKSLGLCFWTLSPGAIEHLTESIDSFGQLEELSLFNQTRKDVPEERHLIKFTRRWFTRSKSLRTVVFNVSEPSYVSERMVRSSSSRKPA